MNMPRRGFLMAATTVVSSLLAAPARAQVGADYPNKPIRLIISFPPGSTSDLLARRVGDHVAKSMGQPVVIESKPGAQGVIAARTVVHAPKDGYTLLLGTNSSHAANLYLVKDLGYDPLKDFSPITQFTTNPLLLVVNADLPVRNLAEFIKYAKDRPGKLSYGTGNTGGQVAAQLLKAQAGIDAVGVNYPGTAQASTDLAAGRLDFMMIDPLVIRPFVQSGKARVLGLTTRQRLPSMPEAVPLAESGLPNFNYESWAGLFGPADLPPLVAQKLAKAFIAAVNDADTVAYFSSLGMIATPSNPEAFQAFTQDQIKVWAQLAKDSGLSPL
ncbi:MAG: putative Bug-like extracytoplasmic solute binding receptor, family [Rhodoferax sp.]|nr:putative Bug-like extracytoplasmic solute binding receptor, family [Rhodoferax sp.]